MPTSSPSPPHSTPLAIPTHTRLNVTCVQDECVSLVTAYHSYCNREVSMSEVTSAYLDCLEMCKEYPNKVAWVVASETFEQVRCGPSSSEQRGNTMVIMGECYAPVR